MVYFLYFCSNFVLYFVRIYDTIKINGFEKIPNGFEL